MGALCRQQLETHTAHAGARKDWCPPPPPHPAFPENECRAESGELVLGLLLAQVPHE